MPSMPPPSPPTELRLPPNCPRTSYNLGHFNCCPSPVSLRRRGLELDTTNERPESAFRPLVKTPATVSDAFGRGRLYVDIATADRWPLWGNPAVGKTIWFWHLRPETLFGKRRFPPNFRLLMTYRVWHHGYRIIVSRDNRKAMLWLRTWAARALLNQHAKPRRAKCR